MTVKELKEILEEVPERHRVYFEDLETGWWHEVTGVERCSRNRIPYKGVVLVSDVEALAEKK